MRSSKVRHDADKRTRGIVTHYDETEGEMEVYFDAFKSEKFLYKDELVPVEGVLMILKEMCCMLYLSACGKG